MNTLSLVIPGLLGPLPELLEQPFSYEPCSILQRWLSRSSVDNASAQNYHDLLAELFGLTSDYSICYFTAVNDNCDISEGFWYRADPVHFKADIDHALLLDHHRLEVMADEAEQLIASFNQHFAEDGIRLMAPHPHRWYLQSEQALNLQTTRLAEAVGRNVNHFLPVGEGALNWRRLLNEAQMLFHMHDVNQQREQQQLLTINSLWLWGEGQDGKAQPQARWDWIISDEPFSRGLAAMAGIPVYSLEQGMLQLDSLQGKGLMVIDDMVGPTSYGDVAAWVVAVESLCEQYLQRLDGKLQSSHFDRVDLFSGEGRRFSILKTDRFKFWRRLRPLTQFVNTHA
ncbi:MAG: hypothetical protein OQL09_04135 [Gammaproteobacteria bacterium]|nr:hypothetical protein [Gammaproteobacteria bacterium]